MKLLLMMSAVFLIAVSVEAFSPVVHQLTDSTEVITIQANDTFRQDFLGTLEGFPVMYEVTNDKPFALNLHLQQRYDKKKPPTLFSVIVVRQNDRGGGVSEVARFQTTKNDWQYQRSWELGIVLWKSAEVKESLSAGTYKIEISTPENYGRYWLSYGPAKTSDGYFADLAGIYKTQRYFGYSPLHIIFSAYVFLPLVLVIAIGFFRLWWYKKYPKHVY